MRELFVSLATFGTQYLRDPAATVAGKANGNVQCRVKRPRVEVSCLYGDYGVAIATLRRTYGELSARRVAPTHSVSFDTVNRRRNRGL